MLNNSRRRKPIPSHLIMALFSHVNEREARVARKANLVIVEQVDNLGQPGSKNYSIQSSFTRPTI
jgi:hypothetical protein